MNPDQSVSRNHAARPPPQKNELKGLPDCAGFPHLWLVDVYLCLNKRRPFKVLNGHLTFNSSETSRVLQ